MAGSIRSANSGFLGASISMSGSDHTIGIWIKEQADAYTHNPNYQFALTASSWAYKHQIWALGNVAGYDNILYTSEAGDVVVATASDTTWRYYLIRKVGTSVTVKARVAGSDTWTTVASYTVTDTPLDQFGIFQSEWPYNIAAYNANVRSGRLWSVNKSDADVLLESKSRTPLDTTNLKISVADGDTPAVAGTNWNGGSYGSITLTKTGTAVYDADDPISGGSSIDVAGHTERYRQFAAGFAPNLALAAATERARVTGNGVLTGLTVAGATAQPMAFAGGYSSTLAEAMTTGLARFSPPSFGAALGQSAQTEPARSKAGDFASGGVVTVAAATERALVRDGGLTSALGASAVTTPVPAASAGITSALGAALRTEAGRMRAGDYSSSGAAVVVSHTERALVRDGGLVAALTLAASTERGSARDAGLATVFAIALPSERGSVSSAGVTTSMAGAVVGTGAAASRDGGTSAALVASLPTEQARMRAGDYSSSGAALLFAHTERALVRDGGLTSAMAAAPATERALARSSDYAAGFAAISASAATEVSRSRDGALSSALVASETTERVREAGAGLTSAAALALATEALRIRPGDFSSSGAAVLFAHTERALVRDGGLSSASAAAAATERGTARGGSFAPAVANAQATERGLVQPAGSASAVSFTAATEAATARGRDLAAALTLALATEAARTIPAGYSTGAVILVSAATEKSRSVPGSYAAQLALVAASVANGERSAGLVSSATITVATEAARAVPIGFGTVVGVQIATAHTERARVRDGAMTGELSVVTFVEPIPGGGGFGSMPFGTGPFGSQMPDGTPVRRIRAVADSVVFVPYVGGLPNANARNPQSPLHPSNWALAPMDPVGAVVRLPQRVLYLATAGRLDGLPYVPEGGFLLVFDGTLAQGAQYRLAVAPASLDLSPEAGVVREFAAVRIRCDALPQDERDSTGGIRDIANPYLSRDALQFPPALGTYQISATGDLASDSGDASLRKRILRRVEATVGDFFHLSNYGAGVVGRVKQLLRPDELERIQSRVKAQVSREPEVLTCSVAVRPVNGESSAVSVSVTVTTVSDPAPSTVVVPVAL